MHTEPHLFMVSVGRNSHRGYGQFRQELVSIDPQHALVPILTACCNLLRKSLSFSSLLSHTHSRSQHCCLIIAVSLSLLSLLCHSRSYHCCFTLLSWPFPHVLSIVVVALAFMQHLSPAYSGESEGSDRRYSVMKQFWQSILINLETTTCGP